MRPHTLRRGRAVPLLLGVVALFLAVELPAYLGFDPAASRVPVRPDYALHYPLLVAHIVNLLVVEWWVLRPGR